MTTLSSGQVDLDKESPLSGLMFGDYYWMAQHHNENIEDRNGFWFRRIYLTYEQELNKSFSTRLRFEANSAGDFESESALTPDVKDAYIKWSKNSQEIYGGISSTPTFGLTEDVWGYRSVEKSPLDLYNFGSSRDFGIALKGKFSKKNRIIYHFFFGNGNGNKAEIDKGKKMMLALAYQITDHVIVQLYGDWNSSTNYGEYVTYQGFTGYTSKGVNVGFLYAHQSRKFKVGNNVELDLASIFTNVTLCKNVKTYLRIDHLFDGYPGGSSNDYLPFAETVESTFFVGGFDFTPAENIHLMPNVETIIYGNNSAGVDYSTTVLPRLSVSFSF